MARVPSTNGVLLALCDKFRENDATANVLDLARFGKIGWEEAEILRDALRGNTRLRDLSLAISERRICFAGLLLLIPFLDTCPSLQTFHFDGTFAGSSYQDVITAILSTISCSETLTKLTLVNMRYDRPELLEKILSKTRRLKELEFSNKGGGDPENFLGVCQSLQRGFQRNETLESITFASKRGPHIEEALFGLFDLPRLKSLELDVVLTREVSQVLRCFFKCNKRLRKLKLTLRTDGESILAPVLGGLAHNRGIQDVEIVASAAVQKCGAAAWTELFQKNTTMKSCKLRSDNLNRHSIDSECATALANGLSCDNVSLQTLDLSATMGEDAFDGAAWQTMIQTNRSLNELCLEGCNIGYGEEGRASFKLFTLGLSQNTSLKKLSLNSNYIGNEGGGALADALEGNEALEVLCLEDNEMEGEDGQAVFRKLWSNKGLHHLDCADNYVGGLGRAFAGGLPKNHTLKQINLRECSLDYDDFRAIFESLHGNKVFVELIMYDNEATLDGSCVTALTELLASTPLRKLDLRGSHISSDGMTPLTDCLRGNTSLTHLNLGECELGNEGLLQLAEALVENATLAELFVDRNVFDADGICGFMQLLPQMKGLTVLRFNVSLFNEAAGLALVKGLKGNKSLETINDLADMELPSDVKDSVEFYLKMNRNGRRFLQESKDEDAVPLPFGAWPRILAKMTAPSERDQLFHFLRHKGEIVQFKSVRRKRKASELH